MMLAASGLCLLLVAAGGQTAKRPPEAPEVHDEHHRQRRLVLAIEDSRNPTPSELDALVALARGRGSGRSLEVRRHAIRALGRLERRDLIPVLTALLADDAARVHASLALLVTLRAEAAAAPDAEVESATDALLQITTSAVGLRHLPYTSASQVRLAETKLLALASQPSAYAEVAGSLETFARRHRRLHALRDAALEFLRDGVRRSLPGLLATDDATPRSAMAALAAAGQADGEIVQVGLRDRDALVRRLAVAALGSAGVSVEAALRTDLTRAALGDPSALVRYEALGAWIRHETAPHGCGPIVAALGDPSQHVVLAAIDALADRCPDDEAMTTLLVSEARTPPTIGDWQREAHALVALARRAPDRAAISMPAFVSHEVWQVRMYAARAAVELKDPALLDRLAYDADDNVREATLAALRALKQSESDAAFIAALGRPDYQLLRTAAIALKDAQSARGILQALIGAFERVTAERKDTSRDTRLALLERIRGMGGPEQRPLYERTLKDFDPALAAAAAEACTAVSPTPCAPEPQLQPRPPLPAARELSERVKAIVDLDSGRRFEMTFDRDLAPLACARFIRLARAHYYDGLTFHRVVPGFVVQGGSPGANEYAGDGPFMRDELGGSHGRGTIGISTRGRHTGDAQIFVNLVDNPRLDYEYTVFATTGQMDVVDAIQEGTRIRRINVVPY